MPLFDWPSSVTVLHGAGRQFRRAERRTTRPLAGRSTVWPAKPITVSPAGKRNTGEEASWRGNEAVATSVIKGTYTQSRLRQMIFGGATRHILANATLPVFMASCTAARRTAQAVG